jgi:hypothetical protein
MPLAPVDTSELHQKSALMQQRRIRHLLDKLNPTGFRKPPSKRACKVHPKILDPLHADRPDRTLRLLRLPVEIRTIIWTPVMTTETGKLHYNAEKNGFVIVSPYQSWRWEVPGLLKTCHQVALSALWLYLKYFRGQRMRCSLRCYYIQRRWRRVGDRLSEWRLENGSSWIEKVRMSWVEAGAGQNWADVDAHSGR